MRQFADDPDDEKQEPDVDDFDLDDEVDYNADLYEDDDEDLEEEAYGA